MGAGTDLATGRWDWTIGRIAWLDAETTDVWDPESPPAMLEICMIVTDVSLRELGRYSAVIDCRDARSNAPPFVLDMHSVSGLWADLEDRKKTTSLRVAEDELCQLLRSTATMHGEMDTRPVVWGGFSPSALDRPLVRLFMPTFYNMIHYRTIDVSTTKLTALNFFGVKIEREAPRHRAEGDTEATLDTFRRITSLISEKTGRCEKVEPFTAAQAK